MDFRCLLTLLLCVVGGLSAPVSPSSETPSLYPTVSTTDRHPVTQGEQPGELAEAVDDVALYHRQKRQSGNYAPVLRDLSTQIHSGTESAFNTYCDAVQYSISIFPAVIEEPTPAGKCRVFSSVLGPQFSIPTPTSVDTQSPVTMEVLKNHQRDSVQLEHTLRQSVDSMIESLKQDVIACSTEAGSTDPCAITCHPARQPEQALSCTISSYILPRLRNYNDLLTLEIGSPSATSPSDITVSGSTDVAYLRYHMTTVVTYQMDQTTANKNIQERYHS